MNRIVADYPDREIHVTLDNLSTHKPKRDLWLARHPKVRFHYTPTHASWLNQIEIWFSIPSGFDPQRKVAQRRIISGRQPTEGVRRQFYRQLQ
jgi:DDE superfamily endonuclease